MIAKISVWILILNLVSIPSSISEMMGKNSSSSTETTSNSSSPSLLSLSQKTSDLISTWSTLVNLFKINKEDGELIIRLAPVLKLAHTIKEFEDGHRRILDSNASLKTKFDSLKADVPERVRNLIWGSKCTIRSADAAGDLYLSIEKSGEKMEMNKLEMSNATKTFWNLQPIPKEFTTSEKLEFTIHSFSHPENMLCVENKKVAIADGWTDDIGTPEICHAGKHSVEKLIRWTLEPFVSAGGRSKGEVIYWMSTVLMNKEANKNLYLSGTLEAADFFIMADGATWEFDCTE